MEKHPNQGNVLTQALALFRPAPKKTSARSARAATAMRMVKASRSSVQKNQKAYQSASISFGKCHGACEAVRELQGTRFLVREVPPVPLPDCTSSGCNCSYVRHKDRRGFTVERRALYSLGAESFKTGATEDQRTLKSRRSEDDPEF
jgi:hypothetical protein